MASNVEKEAIRMAEQKFPVKLHAMLTSLEAEGGIHIASWMPHGCSFKVHNQEKFMAEVLPKWFKLTKHTSFIRQLNIYNFKRISSGVDAGSYHHPNFVRGWPRLAERIERVKVKGSGDPAFTLDPSAQEPDFYRYNPLPHDAGGIPWRQSIEAPELQARLTQESAIQQSLRKQQKQGLAYRQQAQEAAQLSSSLLPHLELRNVASSLGTDRVLALSALQLQNGPNLGTSTNSVLLPPLLPSPLSVESAVRYFTLKATRNNLGLGNLHSVPGPMLVNSSQLLHVGDRPRAFSSFPATAALSPYEAPNASSQFVRALRGEQLRRLLYESQPPPNTEMSSLIAGNRPREYQAPARVSQPMLQLPGDHGSQSHQARESE